MSDKIIDAHMHIGLVGDRWPQWGKFSDEYRKSTVFKSFLTFVQVSAHEVRDETLHERTVKTIGESQVDQVVCLALDPIYDSAGKRREDLSHMWVANEYITDMLRPALPDRVLLGASVHPYDLEFESRTRDMVAAGAVLMKWLPSAQEFSIADHRVGEAMKFLATAKGGKPLPLLLHVGGEYAIPPHDDKNKSNDFLSWSFADGFWNWLRFGKAWYTPDIKGIHYNIRSALEAGATIIFAHCGAPYFSGGIARGLLEHSDFDVVASYVNRSAQGEFPGRCYADISAFVIPMRVPYHDRVKKLPPERVIMGSDFPTPVLELSAGPDEWWKDLKAIITKGEYHRFIVPDGNLLDVNVRELKRIFSDHAMFTNFNKLME